MDDQKRKLNVESSSGTGSNWPWLMAVAIVLLLLGIGLGMALRGGVKDKLKTKLGNPEGPAKGKIQTESTGQGIASLLGKNSDPNGEITLLLVNNPANQAASPGAKRLEFISKNRVYLVPTSLGNGSYKSKNLLRNDPLGAFFNTLKEHDLKNGTFSTNKNPPAEFSQATFGIGPKPIELQPAEHIKYDPAGGTIGQPFHYLLGPMTVLMHNQNPAGKLAGIHLHFPDWELWAKGDRKWLHVAGKAGSGIKPFYLVPLETTRHSAPIQLKVDDCLEFDNATLTVSLKPIISGAIKKLLADNEYPDQVALWAGPPFNKWGMAHSLERKDKNVIDFTEHLLLQKKMSEVAAQHSGHYLQLVDLAINQLFPAANDVAQALEEIRLYSIRKFNSPTAQADLIRATQKQLAQYRSEYMKRRNLFRYSITAKPLRGLGIELMFDADIISKGSVSFDAVNSKWADKKKKAQTVDWKAETVKWQNPKHQQAEWEKFKQHPTFFIGGTIGGSVLPLININRQPQSNPKNNPK